MSDHPDLVIRNGTVLDGSGGDPVEADIAVRDGRIAAIGRALPRGTEEIDARGKLVTPGFVDVHTHYDAQVTWAEHISPSSWNGVTTALIGNCGVGFAPCRPEEREMLVKLMEGVEDIPEPVLTEGLPWTWRSFPDFLDTLAQRRWDMDIATQVPHAALRVHVMGQRGFERAPATAADRAEMARLAAEGIRAGALGFSTSRTIAHRTLAGAHTPTLGAAEAELTEIAAAVGQTGAGWLQVISDFDEPDTEFALLRRVAGAAGRPMTMSLIQRDQRPDLWQRVLAHVTDANAAGQKMTAQVISRPIGVMLGFELSQNPFMTRPSYQAIAHLPFAQRVAALRDPARRAAILAEAATDPVLEHRVSLWEKIFPVSDPPDYEPPPEASVAAMAAARGVDPAALAYDLLLERDGRAILYRAFINYHGFDLETVRRMMTHPHTLLGLGDGGAHVSIICDASAMTTAITHWTRDRTRGAKLPLPWMIKRLSRDNALAMGLADRGLLAPGLRADLNVIDYDRLSVHAPEVRYDLPAGGRRLVQRTEGYSATLVAGQPVYRDGAATGALPGRLVRGGR
ncbi:MAG: amidohydrolase family protein [Rhodospirillales bacterium]|jgi:N-acyl-D-aspartate/D-glutamate deacylase|nr:amidohydrolase family protein [Rhodospirillales bacterium]